MDTSPPTGPSSELNATRSNPWRRWEQSYRRLAAEAARQHGLITATQAGRVGVDVAALDHFRGHALVQEIGRSVYRIPGSAGGERTAGLYAAWLAAAPADFCSERLENPAADIVLSHESACVLMNLGSVTSPLPRFTASNELAAVQYGAKVEIASLAEHEVTVYEGLPVTTPHRTILDLLAERTTPETGSEAMAGVVTDAVRRDLVDLHALFDDVMAQADLYGLLNGGENFIDGFLSGVRPESLPPRNRRAYAELRFPRRFIEIRAEVDRLLLALRDEPGLPLARDDERLGADIAAEIAARTAPKVKRIDENWEAGEFYVDDCDRLCYCGEPFTGELVEHGLDHLRTQTFYSEGVQDGPVTEWWADGSLRVEGHMRSGRPVGAFREWHENGRLARVLHFGEFGPTSDERWDAEGNSIVGRSG